MTVCGVGTHTHADRGDDFYATPVEATRSLLAVERKWFPTGTIWEPACGDGAIVKELRSRNIPTIASDLIDRGCPQSMIADFLISSVTSMPPAGIVTNPPFRRAREFVDKALEHAPYVAMLLRLAFLEADKRKEWFESSPLARVHISSRRLPMMHRAGWTGPKAGSAVCYAWFVWDKRHEGRPAIHWFDYRDYPATEPQADARQVDLEEAIAAILPARLAA